MYPSLETFDRGWLARPDGAELYWETAGNPKGRPALCPHGRPGGSLGKGGYRCRFDPAKDFIIGLDQRGCGRSRPLAIDSPDTLALNTTQSLIRDLEALREHFGRRLAGGEELTCALFEGWFCRGGWRVDMRFVTLWC